MGNMVKKTKDSPGAEIIIPNLYNFHTGTNINKHIYLYNSLPWYTICILKLLGIKYVKTS